MSDLGPCVLAHEAHVCNNMATLVRVGLGMENQLTNIEFDQEKPMLL